MTRRSFVRQGLLRIICARPSPEGARSSARDAGTSDTPSVQVQGQGGSDRHPWAGYPEGPACRAGQGGFPQDADKREWLGTERKTGFERSHMAQICDYVLAMESWALPNLMSSFLSHKTEVTIPTSEGCLL